MGWVKTRVDFDLPWVLLTISQKDMALNFFIEEMIELGERNQDHMVLAFGSLIAKERPDLVGGIVIGYEFDLLRRQWGILYAHPALPRVPQGNSPSPIPLIPEADSPIEVKDVLAGPVPS